METELSYRPGALLLAQAQSASHWAFTGERMAIGRDPASDVHIDDTRISWHHADLIRHGATWSIADAHSTNGTYVNGARVHEAALRPQDRIRLAEIEFVVKEQSLGSTDFSPPDIPKLFIPLVGLGVLLSGLGIALFIFGLIARSGANKEARRLGAHRT